MTKLYLKMLNLKDPEGWVCHCGELAQSTRGGWDIGVGRLAPVGKTVGSLISNPTTTHLLVKRYWV